MIRQTTISVFLVWPDLDLPDVSRLTETSPNIYHGHVFGGGGARCFLALL